MHVQGYPGVDGYAYMCLVLCLCYTLLLLCRLMSCSIDTLWNILEKGNKDQVGLVAIATIQYLVCASWSTTPVCVPVCVCVPPLQIAEQLSCVPCIR